MISISPDVHFIVGNVYIVNGRQHECAAVMRAGSWRQIQNIGYTNTYYVWVQLWQGNENFFRSHNPFVI